MYDPPLLYDLHHDPGEIYNLDVKEYQDVMDEINKVSYTHTLAYIIHRQPCPQARFLLWQLAKWKKVEKAERKQPRDKAIL